MQIVQFRGQTGAFLEPAPGEASLNLLKLAKEGLLYGLRTALLTARKTRNSVRKDGLQVRSGSGWTPVSLEIIPLATSGRISKTLSSSFGSIDRMRSRSSRKNLTMKKMRSARNAIAIDVSIHFGSGRSTAAGTPAVSPDTTTLSAPVRGAVERSQAIAIAASESSTPRRAAADVAKSMSRGLEGVGRWPREGGGASTVGAQARRQRHL
jgi:hypothetical protein